MHVLVSIVHGVELRVSEASDGAVIVAGEKTQKGHHAI